MTGIYDFSAKAIDGKDVPMDSFKGRVMLIVNTASKCGFTKQYTGLEKLQENYAGKGLSVLGFPCDQFLHQEPGDDAEIANFCTTNYNVTFPMFSKVEVNGDNAHPLWKYLKHEKGGLLISAIKWNFTKFLVGRDGTVIGRYPPNTTPEEIVKDIEAALAKG